MRVTIGDIFDTSYINSTINKNIDRLARADVLSMTQAVQKIWSMDTVIKNFTSHKLDHNLRVLEYCYKLLEVFNTKLDSTGYYILTMAALLHDIGMQCTDDEIVSKYCSEDAQNDESRQKAIRKNHAKIGVAWIAKLRANAQGDMGKLVGLIDPTLLNSICTVIFYHSGEDIFGTINPSVYYHRSDECRLMPLIFILRFSDELDIGSERSNEDTLLLGKLPIDSRAFFWLHKITHISFVKGNIVKVSIELNPADYDKKGFLKECIFDHFISKNERLLRMMQDYCDYFLSIEFDSLENPLQDMFDPNVFDYLTSKQISQESFFKQVPRLTYKVDNIVEVYNLDNRLLPTLYRSSDVNYAVTKEQSILCNRINPFMTIAAYKGSKLIGYLTLWPVAETLLDKLLNFELLESDLNFGSDLFTYDEENIDICWYVSGLGVCNEERGLNNHPAVLQELFNKSIDLASEVIKPKGIRINRIGAVVYTRTAELLCMRHFNMSICKIADYSVDNYVPKSVAIDLRTETNSDYIQRLKKIINIE